jgi:hypothetical protein
VNCPRCGAFHHPNTPTCAACGTPLTVSLSGPAPVPAYGAPPPYASPPQPQPYAPPAQPPPYAPPAQPVAYPPTPPPYAPGGYPPGVPYGAPSPAPGPYDAAAYPYVEPKTSAMAIIGFVFAFLCSFVGLVLSIIALVRINNSRGQLRGKSFAVAGIILASIFLVVSIVYKVAN